MGNLDFSANADQLKELAAYMASQINVPTIGIGGGYAPIGTIISVMGTTAPQDYLACDGTVYNIADYPQLADYFESQFGESNHFGGNGTTTFAVPDLQGEFLRGTGTNSHTNQGSGANVGVHQDGTEHIAFGFDENSYSAIYINSNKITSDDRLTSTKRDATLKDTTKTDGSWFERKGTYTGDGVYGYTSRPTNTSVLYCIKAVVAGEVYSTEERVVGTWIDGKPIYQKTYNYASSIVIPADNTTVNVKIADTTSLNISELISIKGSALSSGGNQLRSIPDATPTGDARGTGVHWMVNSCYVSNLDKGLYVTSRRTNNTSVTLTNVKLTIKYTKTTD